WDQLPKEERDPRDTSLMRVISGKADDTDRRRAGEALAAWTTLASLAEQIAARSRCDFALEWEKAPELPFPPYTPMRAVARLLAAKAVLAGEEDRNQEAFAALEAAGHVERHIGEEPVLLSLLVQRAVEDTVSQAFVQIVKAHGDGLDLLRMAAAADGHLS